MIKKFFGRKWVRRLFWLLLILFIVFVAIKVVKHKMSKPPEKPARETATVSRGDIQVKITETGQFAARHEVRIRSQISGKILKLNVHAGDTLRVGQVVAEIEPDYLQAASLDQTRQKLEQARLDLDQARRDAELDNSRYAGTVTVEQRKQYKEALSRAEIAYRAAQVDYANTENLGLDKNSEKSVVYCPTNGVVISVEVAEGEMVAGGGGSYSEGTVLCTVADPRTLVVKAQINERDYGRISKGQPVQIQVDAYPYDNFTGTISSIAPQAVANSDNMQCFAAEITPDKPDARFYIGMTANLTIIGEKHANVLMLPQRAVFMNKDGKPQVYLTGADSTLTAQLVTLGASDLDNVEILGGVKEGDVVSLTAPIQGVTGPQVTTTVAQKTDMAVKLEDTGVVVPHTKTSVRSKISGEVTKILVAEGDYVKKGQLLAEIKPDYRQAQELQSAADDVERSRINLQAAQRDESSKKELLAKNLLSSEEWRSAADNLERRRIEFNLAQNNFSRMREMELQKGVSRIVAPVAGTVLEKKVEVGEFVTASTSAFASGTVLFNIADLENLDVTLNLVEIDIDKVHVGYTATITVDALPDLQLEGKVTRITPAASLVQKNRCFPVEIAVKAPLQGLKPGMTVNVVVQGQHKNNVVVIPLAAIFSNDDREDVVYKMVKGVRQPATTIKTGINDNERVEIISGVVAGDTLSLVEEPHKTDLDKIQINFN